MTVIVKIIVPISKITAVTILATVKHIIYNVHKCGAITKTHVRTYLGWKVATRMKMVLVMVLLAMTVVQL